MKFLEPWMAIASLNSLETQLKRQLSKNHDLRNLEWTMIAYRIDQDDILLQIKNESRVAEVHLTWGNKPDTHLQFPGIVFYSSFEDWFENHEEDF